MRHIVICDLPGSSYFSTLSHQRYDFRQNVTEHKTCVLLFSTTFVWNISHSKKNWMRYDQKLYRSSCKVPVILVWIQWKFTFLDRFSRNTQNITFHENPYIGSRVVQCGRADMMMPIAVFRNFANAPNTTDYSTFSSFAGHDWKIFRTILKRLAGPCGCAV